MRDVEFVELMNPVWSWNYFHTHTHILFCWTQSQGSGFICLFMHLTNSQSVRYAHVNTSIQALLPQIMMSSKAPDLYRVIQTIIHLVALYEETHYRDSSCLGIRTEAVCGVSDTECEPASLLSFQCRTLPSVLGCKSKIHCPV